MEVSIFGWCVLQDVGGDTGRKDKCPVDVVVEYVSDLNWVSHCIILIYIDVQLERSQDSRKSRARFCASSILQRTQPTITKVQSEYQAMGRKTQGILSILRVTKAQYRPECSIRSVERTL